MYLDFLQLCFGVLILCSLEYSFREAARERQKERRENEEALRTEPATKIPTVPANNHVLLVQPKTPRPKRARINSLPVYRSKELNEALREARVN